MMDKRPTDYQTESQQADHVLLKETSHSLTASVHRRNNARSEAGTAKTDLANYESWHPQFKNADAKMRMRWNAMNRLQMIAWICDGVLVATFAAFLAHLFAVGKILLAIVLTVAFTLILSLLGVGLIVGTRLMIEERRRERNIPSMHRWQAAGVLVSLIPLLLIFGVGFGLSANHLLGTIAVTIAQLHLIWVALVAVIATSILVFSGDLGNTARGFLLYKKTVAAKQAVVAEKDGVSDAADRSGVHHSMSLFEGTQSYVQTYGAKPVLPPFDAEVHAFVREKFPHLLSSGDGGVPEA